MLLTIALDSPQILGIGSGNGLPPVRYQAITRTNADLLSIRHLGANFNEIRIEIQNFSFIKLHFKMLYSEMAPILSTGRWLKEDQVVRIEFVIVGLPRLFRP